ncbi:hypothetical protein CLOP_g1696 [Closterium sp. NIES-67]|nr:hypothetical protein CLOP_g1696 [Closterium sp. NIES-67]
MAPQRIPRRAVLSLLHRLGYTAPPATVVPPSSFPPLSIPLPRVFSASSCSVPGASASCSASPIRTIRHASFLHRFSHPHAVSRVSHRRLRAESRALFSSEARLASINPATVTDRASDDLATDPDRPQNLKQAQPQEAKQSQPQDGKQSLPQDPNQSQPQDPKPSQPRDVKQTKEHVDTVGESRRLAKSLARQSDLPDVTQVLDDLVHRLLVLPENLAKDPIASASTADDVTGVGKEGPLGQTAGVKGVKQVGHAASQGAQASVGASAQELVDGSSNVSSSSSSSDRSNVDVEANAAAAMEHLAAANERSLNSLLRFLNSLAPHNLEHPPAGTMDLTFHIRSQEGIREGEEEGRRQEGGDGGVAAGTGGSASGEGSASLRNVQLRIRTTGGNCKDLVGRQLSDFFRACGVSSQFVWPEGYWNLLSPATVAKQLAKEGAEAAAASAKAAKAQQQQQQQQKDRKNQPGLEAALDALDGALAAIASAPWHESLEDKKRFEDQLLAVLVADGWKVRESVKRMWAGERDVRKLSLGLDEGSARMVGRVLRHAEGNDKEHGKMIYLAEGMEEILKGEGDAGGGGGGGEMGAEKTIGKVEEKKGSLKIEVI